MASMSPPSACPCVLDTPEATQNLCQPLEPSVHSHVHMEELVSWAAVSHSRFSLCILVHPSEFWGTLLVVTSLSSALSQSYSHVVTPLAKDWEQASLGGKVASFPSASFLCSPCKLAYPFPSITRKNEKQTSGHVLSPCICGTCANISTHMHLLSLPLLPDLCLLG